MRLGLGHKLPVVLGILLAVMFTTGFFTYQFFFASPKGPSDKFGIHGHVVVKAYHADGTLYAVRECNNVLVSRAKNAIAGCATGIGATPSGFGACSGWLTTMRAEDGSWKKLFFFGSITNTLLPSGCDPTTGAPLCDQGWISQATIDITQNASIFAVGAGVGTSPADYVPFDSITLPSVISANEGDRLVVTITFTIS